MIDYLQKLINNQSNNQANNQASQEEKVDYQDYFNRKLIFDPEIKDYFNQFYEIHYKCWICYDVVFDPIYCPECQLVFCKSCVTNSLFNSKSIKCSHRETLRELTKQEKLKFEKIKVNCFFKCGSQKLNLLNYPDHLIGCKAKYNERNLKTNEVKTTTFSNEVNKIHLETDEIGSIVQLKKLNQINTLKMQEKDLKNKSLQSLLIQTRQETISMQRILDKTNRLFIEMEDIKRETEVCLNKSYRN